MIMKEFLQTIKAMRGIYMLETFTLDESLLSDLRELSRDLDKLEYITYSEYKKTLKGDFTQAYKDLNKAISLAKDKQNIDIRG
jgi:hypothetical protein